MQAFNHWQGSLSLEACPSIQVRLYTQAQAGVGVAMAAVLPQPASGVPQSLPQFQCGELQPTASATEPGPVVLRVPLAVSSESLRAVGEGHANPLCSIYSR